MKVDLGYMVARDGSIATSDGKPREVSAEHWTCAVRRSKGEPKFRVATADERRAMDVIPWWAADEKPF